MTFFIEYFIQVPSILRHFLTSQSCFQDVLVQRSLRECNNSYSYMTVHHSVTNESFITDIPTQSIRG